MHTEDEILELTSGHYLYVNGNLKTASDVAVGDELKRSDGSSSRIVEIRHVVKQGVFNPQTTQGDIVVNGFVVSTYTQAIEPEVAHSLLTPFRALYAALRLSTSFLYYGMPTFLQSSSS